MGFQDVAAGLLQERLVEGIFPFAQLDDEIALLLPFLGALRGRDQGGVGGGAAGCQRAARPPDVQRADVPVADVILPSGDFAYFFDGEGFFI